MRARWYFSLRSPYSWLAYRDLASRFPNELDNIEWLPYWEPDASTSRMLAERGIELPLTEMPRAKNLYILQDARRIARDRGLEITWPLDRRPCWEVPHLAYLVASDHGQARAFVAAAYEARWEHGKDICDPRVAAEIGRTIGLDPTALCEAAEDSATRERGVDLLARGAQDGVFGVPFFMCGKDKFWGLERVPHFVDALRATSDPVRTGLARSGVDDSAIAEDDAPAWTGHPVQDGGHAGGCG